MPLKYIDNVLHLQQREAQYSLLDMAKEVGQPFYLYDLEGIDDRISYFKNSFHPKVKIHYALKANNNADVLKVINKNNLGLDVVSGGELTFATTNGFSGDRIIFSGVGKTVKEIRQAIELELFQLNVESPQELERIGQLAAEMQTEVNVAFRLNPDVKPETHPYITTGFRNNKFGMDESFLPELLSILERFPNLNFSGLTMHIGSQIKQIETFEDAIDKLFLVCEKLKREGLPVQTLDVGGGLGINYQNYDPIGDDRFIHLYAMRVNQLAEKFEGTVLLEPGRILVAPFGWLIGEVQYIKKTPWKNFVIMNTGMNHLLRPALYQAFHRMTPVFVRSEEKEVYEIVGPICESSDVLGQDRWLSKIVSGDFLAIEDAGAYGRVMSSTYNLHSLPREISV